MLSLSQFCCANSRRLKLQPRQDIKLLAPAVSGLIKFSISDLKLKLDNKAKNSIVYLPTINLKPKIMQRQSVLIL
jgi:hypothetical protein